MTEFRLESASLDPFHIARLHGFTAFNHLSTAYRTAMRWEDLRDQIAGMSEEERFHNIGPAMRKPSLEEWTAQRLFVAVMLYQASMEAVVFRATQLDQRVREALEGEKWFAPRWRGALGAVGKETDAFDRYKSEIYDEYRKPVTHLDSQVRVEKVNDITFRDIYCGLRAGWWAHGRLLQGMDLISESEEENWSTLCQQVGLPDDLYPDDDLVADAAD